MQAAYARWVASGVRRWPELRVVFALLAGGAPLQLERLVRCGLDPRAPFAPNMRFDTSSYGGRALELTLQAFGFSFDATYIHDVRHDGGRPATSIHVYSPALWRMGRYELGPRGLGRVSLTYVEEVAA